MDSNTCDVMKSKSKLLAFRRWPCTLTMRLMLVRTTFFFGALHLLLSTIFVLLKSTCFCTLCGLAQIYVAAHEPGHDSILKKDQAPDSGHDSILKKDP